MFNKSNFCHIASNNRNEQKGSVFIYKTSDTLAQVTQSGYFNEKLIDINVHDLIIHVQYNPVDRTLKKSVLIVTERTLDNVETTPILDQTIGDDIADLGEQVAGIEEKIPGNANSTNQLATASDINTKITNCITEIPQDIQVQTSGETVTLKAGSKVYIPNGNGVFNEMVISADISNTGGAIDAFVVTNGRNLNWTASAFSGTTAPSTPTTGMIWYDTANNLVKIFTADGSWVSGYSLPVALFNSQDNSKTKIFNGFGYIGSTVFALPGVKGLVPSGRNADGTLKNGIVTLKEVSIYNKSGNFDKWGVYISTGGKLYSINNSFVYNEHENLIRRANDGTPFGVFQCGTATSVNNRISLQPKTTFHAVDYSDFETLSDTVETLSDTVEALSDTVETNNNNAVHKTGDETISGTKTFTAPSLKISNVAGTGGTGLTISDSNGKGQTYIQQFYTNGRYYSRLVNRNNTAAKTSYVEVVVNDDGKSEFTSYNIDNMYAPTPVASSNDTNIATTAWVNSKISASLPAGVVVPFAGKTAPSGWLKCDGSAVSRTTYAALFAAIGTTYGAGNGSTTFNLPKQSVLPLGTSAPVIGNGQAIGMTGTKSGVLVARDIGTGAGTVHGMLTITNNENMPNGTLYKFTDSTGLKADLASATGAKAIVCIKY